MNSEIKVLHPRPSKTNDHIFFKQHLTNSNCHNYLNYTENILEDLSKVRENSQNPQKKDASFKSQSPPENIEDFPENWSEFEEISSL